MAAANTCTAPGCTAPMRRDGLCFPHLILATRSETGTPAAETTAKTRYTCSECTAEVHAKGLCKPHYEAARRTGDLDSRKCNMADCEEAHSARGLCARHYMQARRGNPAAQAAAA